jgi:hypothetical protein
MWVTISDSSKYFDFFSRVFIIFSIFLQSSVNGIQLNCTYSNLYFGDEHCEIENIDLSKTTIGASFKFSPTENEKTRTTGIEFQASGKVAHLPQNLKQVFPNLVGFWLEQSDIPILRNNLFGPQFKWIVFLYLDKNGIQMIEENAFAQLTNLFAIRLGHNKLKSLNINLFKSNPKLEWILIANNQINMIERDTFRHLHKLHNLDLSGNECIDKYFYSLEGKMNRKLGQPLAKCYVNHQSSLGSLKRGNKVWK